MPRLTTPALYRQLALPRTLPRWSVPYVPRDFTALYSGRPALLNRYYRGATTDVLVPFFQTPRHVVMVDKTLLGRRNVGSCCAVHYGTAGNYNAGGILRVLTQHRALC